MFDLSFFLSHSKPAAHDWITSPPGRVVEESGCWFFLTRCFFDSAEPSCWVFWLPTPSRTWFSLFFFENSRSFPLALFFVHQRALLFSFKCLPFCFLFSLFLRREGKGEKTKDFYSSSRQSLYLVHPKPRSLSINTPKQISPKTFRVSNQTEPNSNKFRASILVWVEPYASPDTIHRNHQNRIM